MNKKQIVEDVGKYLEPILNENHLELVDIEFVKEGSTYFLRIFIDKEGGVTIDDCQLTSRAIEKVLDEKDIIEPAYILEVSSPGLDRVLKKDKDFEKFAGNFVDVRLYEPLNKKKQLTAKLIKKTQDMLIVEDEENGAEALQIPLKNVALVRLAIMF